MSLGAVVDDGVGAQLECPTELPGPTHRGEDTAAGGAGDLDPEAPDAAAAGDDQDVLAGPDRGAVHERVVGAATGGR
nr:hypothetical protein [Rhodococcus yananensis]